MSPDLNELINRLRALATNWDKVAEASREMADKDGTGDYTKGYGYGAAETLKENAAKIRSLIALAIEESK